MSRLFRKRRTSFQLNRWADFPLVLSFWLCILILQANLLTLTNSLNDSMVANFEMAEESVKMMSSITESQVGHLSTAYLVPKMGFFTPYRLNFLDSLSQSKSHKLKCFIPKNSLLVVYVFLLQPLSSYFSGMLLRKRSVLKPHHQVLTQLTLFLRRLVYRFVASPKTCPMNSMSWKWLWLVRLFNQFMISSRCWHSQAEQRQETLRIETMLSVAAADLMEQSLMVSVWIVITNSQLHIIVSPLYHCIKSWPLRLSMHMVTLWRR